MKKIFSYILLSLIIISCSLKKNEIVYKQNEIKKVLDNLSTEEINIVNDFLETELKMERYKIYNKLEIVLIEEANFSIANLNAYEYAYKDFHRNATPSADNNERLGWILDTTQINQLKIKNKNELKYHWKNSDIKNYKVTIMKDKTLRDLIKSGEYINLPEKLILHITKPLIIDEKNALVSFSLNNSHFGTTINRYTALMKKNNGKWKIEFSYSDGMMD